MFTLKDNEALNALKEQMQASKVVVRGVLRTTSKGFGFLARESGNDVIVPKELTRGLLPESELLVYIESHDKGEQVSEIIEVVDRGNTDYFCKIDVFSVEDREYVNARPLRNDLDIKIQLGQKKSLDVEHGDIALVKINDITTQPTERFKGTLASKIGHESDPSTIWGLVKSEFNLNNELDEFSTAQLPIVTDPVVWAEENGYLDWTNKPFVTIDAFSSRDLDDALYVEDLGNHWCLHIAIADPTILTEDNTELRKLLLSRGVTHYLANEVIHLMVQSFSENHFSLLEDQLRPALGAVINIDKYTGELGQSEFSLVLIKSQAKLTYDQVSEHIRQRAVPIIDENQPVAESLNQLYEMSQKRLEYRQANSIVGFDGEEYYFVLEDSMPVDVKEVVKKLSHGMVEEAAIVANIAFTEWANALNLPIIHVTHSGFKPEKSDNLKEYLQSRNVPFSEGDSLDDLFELSHRILTANLAQLSSDEDPYIIALAERNLTELRAYYQKGEITLERKPHMPMGLSAYATWTSPIRKSVDMENHLIIKAHLKGNQVAPPSQEDVFIIQERIRASRLAERRLSRLIGLTYMKGRVDATISVKVTGVLKKALRVDVVGTGITATMGFRELGFKGYVELDPINQLVLVDEKPMLRLSDIFLATVRKVSVYEGEIVLIRNNEVLKVDANEECEAA